MPKYDRPVRVLIQEAADALGMTATRPISKDAIVSWFGARYPLVKRGTIEAHLNKHSVNVPSRVHYSPKPDGSDDFFFRLDPKTFRRFDRLNDSTPISGPSGGASGPQVEVEEVEPAGHSSAFAYEHDLRDYLARNLSLVEPGLRLYEEEGITGKEFPVGGRFIDILAVDRTGSLVIIELKVSRGYDRVVGQLLRYMGWIQMNLAEPSQRVRGVIIANDITDDLCLACLRIPDVELIEYELAVTLRAVSRELVVRGGTG